MALSKDKVRIVSNVPIELKEKIDKLALEENRSSSNLIYHILDSYIEKHEQKKK
jgi:predicted DNA-binding protein